MEVVRDGSARSPFEEEKVHRNEEQEAAMPNVERKERFPVVERFFVLNVLRELGLESVCE